MKQLLQHVNQQHTAISTKSEMLSEDDAVLIVGDFNQQRPQDYTPTEWDRIVANKRHRTDEAPTDGVDALLNDAGFVCVWDGNTDASSPRNWPPDVPPPATHWSGTVIDYVYSRGGGIHNMGTYVSPSGLSDHRLIVTDWKVE